ncbi:12867_t:CDS:2 [Ambispora gerdemannii]|uniref:12867_t:CDS:1 n=1 Tax=Ambispora gerdemannii TaxID=144530 RepID=A0A9N9A7B4_9GLOM|nr:12867_t:CDS:2 [Ambispora gerdemannii]
MLLKVLFLDLSVNWTIIDNLFNAPTFNYATFSALKKNNRSLIYVFGGLIPTNESDWNKGTYVNSFYQIDVTSYTISISSVTSGGALPARHISVSSFLMTKENFTSGLKTVNETTDQTMYIYDTFDSTWDRAPSYFPTQRSG